MFARRGGATLRMFFGSGIARTDGTNDRVIGRACLRITRSSNKGCNNEP